MITVIFVIIMAILIIGVIGDIGIGGVLGIALGLIAVFVIGVFVKVKVDEKRQKDEEELRKTNPELWEKRQEEKRRAQAIRDNQRKLEEQRKENADEKKYNNYKYTCPMCQSKKVRNLTFDERTNPLNARGKVGKNYCCDDCKYIW